MYGRTIYFTTSERKQSIPIDRLIEKLAAFNKAYPGCYIVSGDDELRIYRVLNNGGTAEYVSQILF